MGRGIRPVSSIHRKRVCISGGTSTDRLPNTTTGNPSGSATPFAASPRMDFNTSPSLGEGTHWQPQAVRFNSDLPPVCPRFSRFPHSSCFPFNFHSPHMFRIHHMLSHRITKFASKKVPRLSAFLLVSGVGGPLMTDRSTARVPESRGFTSVGLSH